MKAFFQTYKKRIALLCAMAMFVFASGYTSIYSLSKTLEVRLNERSSVSSEPETITIANANYNRTLKEILEENNLPTSDDYVYGTDLDKKVREVDILSINKKINGTISVDNEVLDYSSGADTVSDVLEENEIKLSPSDSVDPTPDTALATESASITVHRQNQKREVREEEIPYETTQTPDSTLAVGTVVVDVPGSNGKKRITEDVTYRDGTVIKREVVKEETLIEPITQTERVGSGNGTSIPRSNTYASNGNSSGSTGSVSNTKAMSGNSTASLSDSDFDLVCAIVQHESGGSYDSALAVMSCVMNRVDNSNYPDDPVSVLTAPGQFASYLDGYYKQFTGGRASSSTQQAVRDCLNGKRNHPYLNFRSYKTNGSKNIGGNWYF